MKYQQVNFKKLKHLDQLNWKGYAVWIHNSIRNTSLHQSYIIFHSYVPRLEITPSEDLSNIRSNFSLVFLHS